MFWLPVLTYKHQIYFGYYFQKYTKLIFPSRHLSHLFKHMASSRSSWFTIFGSKHCLGYCWRKQWIFRKRKCEYTILKCRQCDTKASCKIYSSIPWQLTIHVKIMADSQPQDDRLGVNEHFSWIHNVILEDLCPKGCQRRCPRMTST